MKKSDTTDPQGNVLDSLVEYCRENADLPIGMLRRELEDRTKTLRSQQSQPDSEFVKDTIILFKLRFVMAELIMEALSNQLDPRSVLDQRDSERQLTRQKIRTIAKTFGLDQPRLGFVTGQEFERIKTLLIELRENSITSGAWRHERLNHLLDPVGGHNSDTLLRYLCAAPEAAKTTHAIFKLHGPLGSGQQASAPFIRKS